MKQPEPTRGCLLALKDIILRLDAHITQQRKFQIPFFYYKDKKLCFLWVDRKKPIIGFVEDKNIYPKQAGVTRKNKMELLYLDPSKDIPLKTVERHLKALIKLYEAHPTTQSKIKEKRYKQQSWPWKKRS